MGKSLEFLYETAPGRAVLKVLTNRHLSELAGRFCDSPLSKPLIKPFVKNNGIDLMDCESTDFKNFNDCFTRKLRAEERPFDENPDSLVSPCDGLLSIWKIKDDTVLPIKQSHYSVSDLLGSCKEAEEFKDGLCLVFRLCVTHYHRYAYLDDGTKGKNIFIPGKLHTVQPIALRHVPVFTENCREVTYLDTKNFGRVAQVEVGAMLVGKIANHHEEHTFKRGEEKGMFLYGGSTIVVLLKKDAVRLRKDFKDAAVHGTEIPVRMGERIGSRKS